MKQRMLEIFKAIVEEFIQTAEPVGSKTIMNKYNLEYSSATIRNDMQELEEMGYLEKTHTSSGRVPSTLGYQFYCQNFMDQKLDNQMVLAFNSLLDDNNLELQEVIEKSVDILADMTNLATGALGPDSSTQRLEYIKIFPIDDKNLVCVLITDTGHTETKNFKFDESIPVEDIKNCADILNSRLKGTTIDEVPEKLIAIRPILETHLIRHELLFKAFMNAFTKFANENLRYSKTSNILYQPEYSDIEKIKDVMSRLENDEVWDELAGLNETGLITNSGSSLYWLDDIAVVKTGFKVNKNEEGQLLIVGPSRMDYNKIVAVLEYVAKMIESIYNQGDDDGRK